MKKEIQFHPEVIEEIKGSYDWYESKVVGLGNKFLEELESGYLSIQTFPNMWANFQYGFKRYLLVNFPFSILYKVTTEQIIIIAIMHNSRKPNYWIDRII
jgi:plasmid stabilization system protein ParE